MRGASLPNAQAAKKRLLQQMMMLPELQGIGIAILKHGYGVKVNLSRSTAVPIPADIDGVPVIVEVLGEIRG